MPIGWLITPIKKISVATPFILWSSKSSGKPLWQLGDSTRDLESQTNILLSFVVIRMLNLSIVFICVVIMHIFLFIYDILYYVSIMWCHLWFGLWRGSIKVYSFAHTHMHFHDINSIPEFRPCRRKCWLCSREIVISAMASQTFPEFMVLMTSWGCNLRTVIRKCSHSNRTLSIWSL